LFLSLELSDPVSVRKSAEEFLKLEDRLDVLVNNAAMIIEEYHMGSLGIQDIAVIDHLSPIVFTHTLLPLLKSTAAQPGSDVRIVNVSSDAHNFISSGVHFAKKDDFNVTYKGKWFASMRRYGHSKLAFTLWSNELQRRLLASSELGAEDIIVIAIHPGSVYTENTALTASKLPFPIAQISNFLVRLVFLNVLTGAATPLIASAGPQVRKEMKKYQGAYLVPVGKIGKCSKVARDEGLAKECWDTTMEVLKEVGVEVNQII